MIARRLWQPLLVALVFVGLGVRLVLFTDTFAADVLFMDQWDFLSPLFAEADLWSLFRWQHGPHRQGLGQWLIAATYALTSWSVRAEAFVGVGLLGLAALLVLYMLRRVHGRWVASDLVVPLLLLTTLQWELVAATVNLAHGPAAVLSVVFVGWATLVASPWLRALAMVITGFVATHTGFGFFVGLLLPLAFLLWWWRDRDERLPNAVGLAGSIASVAVFFSGWAHNPAVTCFRFPDGEPRRYLIFPGMVLLQRFGVREVHGWQILAPLIVGALAVGLVAVLRRGRGPRTPARRLEWVGLLWLAFGLLFIVAVAYGRVCMGLRAALSPRYAPYVSVLLLGVYLLLRHASGRGSLGARFVIWFLIFLLGTAEVVRNQDNRRWAGRILGSKEDWVACYRRERDVEACETRQRIHPNPDACGMREKINYLESNRLNIFFAK